MKAIDQILKAAVEKRASDIHFSAGEPVWARIDGDLAKFTDEASSHEDLDAMFAEILTEAERERLTTHRNLDKSHYIEGVGNFRVNIFYSRRGIGSVIRTLPSKIPTIDQLGLPAVVKSLAELPKGLILVTGPTGSGKSTTLASIINHMNENFPYHILTAEDPVEFIHPSKKSLINQREIGQSCNTFADALKYALREDPDVILVGEMRDLETISLAMTAAETGHLVLGTLHTRGAASTIDRIIESFPAMQQPMVRAMLSESLQAVISQTLLKRANGSGRVACYEIMVMNYAISNLVREGKTFQIPSIMQTGRREGMMLMEAHVRELAAAGEVSEFDAEALISSISRGHTSKSGGGAPAATTTPAYGAVTATKPPEMSVPPVPPVPKVPGAPLKAVPTPPPVAAPAAPAKAATPPAPATVGAPKPLAPPPPKVPNPAPVAKAPTSAPLVPKAAALAPKAPAPKAPAKPKLAAPEDEANSAEGAGDDGDNLISLDEMDSDGLSGITQLPIQNETPAAPTAPQAKVAPLAPKVAPKPAPKAPSAPAARPVPVPTKKTG